MVYQVRLHSVDAMFATMEAEVLLKKKKLATPVAVLLKQKNKKNHALQAIEATLFRSEVSNSLQENGVIGEMFRINASGILISNEQNILERKLYTSMKILKILTT